jgi:hypothetical protein
MSMTEATYELLLGNLDVGVGGAVPVLFVVGADNNGFGPGLDVPLQARLYAPMRPLWPPGSSTSPQTFLMAICTWE